MKKLVSSLVLMALALPARGETLRFQPHIQRADLAEEAIALLHCLSDRSGTSWEFTGASGPHSLELHETSDAGLKGVYRRDGKETALSLRLGEAEKACAEVYPSTAFPVSAPSVPFVEEEVAEPTALPWGWIGVSSLGILGGFLLWKSQRGADHQAILMR